MHNHILLINDDDDLKAIEGIEDNIAMINGQTRNLTREAFTQL